MNNRCAVTEDENRYQSKLCKEDADDQHLEALVSELESDSSVVFEDSEGEYQTVTIFDCVTNAIENERMHDLLVELFEAFSVAGQPDVMTKAIAIKEQLLADAKFLIEAQLD